MDILDLSPRIGYATDVPTEGHWPAGSQVFHTDATANEPAWWTCIVRQTPTVAGVWQPGNLVDPSLFLPYLDEMDAYWRADAFSTGTVPDGTGGGRDLTVFGGATESGGRIVLDGVDDYLEAATDALWSIGAGQGYTVAARVSLTNIDTNHGIIQIPNNNNVSTSQGFSILNTTAGSDQIRFFIGDGSNPATLDGRPVVVSTEHTLALRLDRDADLITGFIDGVAVGTADASALGAVSAGVNTLKIGHYGANYAAITFVGAAIKADALVDADVRRLHLALSAL